MPSYQAFFVPRAVEADIPTLAATLRALDASADLQHTPGTANYIVKKATAWTGPQITAAENAIVNCTVTTPALVYARSSKMKDLLATLAVGIRGRNVAAWNALTIPQKVAATQAEADIWANIRDFAEVNL
jgi:hypothetical protein